MRSAFDVVLIETVGVGQSEIEIAELAQTTLVALQPGSGDSIQVLKAGIMEIADIFVVNKADHPMANQLRREIRSMMEMLQFHGLGARTRDDAGARRAKASTSCGRRSSVTPPISTRPARSSAKRREAFAHQVRQLALGRLQRRLDAASQRRPATESILTPRRNACWPTSADNVGEDEAADRRFARGPTVKGLT